MDKYAINICIIKYIYNKGVPGFFLGTWQRQKALLAEHPSRVEHPTRPTAGPLPVQAGPQAGPQAGEDRSPIPQAGSSRRIQQRP